MRRPSLPVLVLVCAGVLAAVCLAFVYVAPNRLLSGPGLRPQAGWLAAAWLVALFAAPWRSGALVAVLLTLGLPLLAGYDAMALLAHASPATRIQAGAGFWVQWLAACLLLLHQLRGLATAWRWVAWLVVGAGVVAAAWLGWFSGMALVREWQAQRGAFASALASHMQLSLLTLAIALCLGAPLGYVAWRSRRVGGPLLGALSFLQTVPSLALFALLIGPFAWLARAWPGLGALGFGGTGAAPAVCALVLYALLPVVRYTVTGLDTVPAEAREAARGIGMTRWQLLASVQLPMAWPVLLAGLRIVAVQTIGLAAVAALIGAGGLGRFVFLGIGQGASDMVLLGTLSIIALALLVDLLFQGLLATTERRA